MRNIAIITIGIASSLLILSACKKDKFDLPPAKNPPANSGIISIDSLKKKYVSYYITTVPKPTSLFRFPNDANIECTVTADEVSGNIYKQIFVEDASGAITIKLINSGGFTVGDKIRINLNNVLLNDYGKLIQLDSVDAEKKIIKLSSGNIVKPTKLTTNQLLSLDGNGLFKYQSRLVTLDTVEFAAGEKGKTFADPVNKYSYDRTLLDASANIIATVRTSGYANFAGSSIPCGKGSLTAIMGQYNSDPQLTIRTFTEVKLSSGGCPLLIKSFDDGSATSGGWINYNVSGSINWTGGTYSGRTYGQISNYVSGSNQACETWLISPPIDISGSTNPRFSFQSAYNYSGPTLTVVVSTNYSGGNPTAATWGTVNPALSAGSWSWKGSGNVSLTGFKSANTRIAFKYAGTGTAGSTWEIDDIAVFGE